MPSTVELLIMLSFLRSALLLLLLLIVLGSPSQFCAVLPSDVYQVS